MNSETAKPKRGLLFWIGWVLTILPAAALLMSAVMKVRQPMPPEMAEGMAKVGWEVAKLTPIAITEAICTILYLIPQTAVLGAVLLTGYLGGATATHVRVGDGFAAPVIMGVLIWLALVLREPRLRSLLPWRKL
jgi:hypothetical protein